MEFQEIFFRDGSIKTRLNCDSLPIAYDGRKMTYEILMHSGGTFCEGKSRAQGDGSIRYYQFYGAECYRKALDHATEWAKRKIRESR